MSNDADQYTQAARTIFAEEDQGYKTLSALGAELLSEFDRARADRQEIEQRWLKDLRQYKGIYEPDVESKFDKNRSRVFVRKTRVKVRTLNARMRDLLFPNGSTLNWTIGATPKPSISPEQRKQIIAGLLRDKIEPTQAAYDKAVSDFAANAAKRMGKTIEDQLADTKYRDVALKVLHSGHVYGHGILKAPLVEKKVRTRFSADPKTGRWTIQNEAYAAPYIEHVPVWRWYPDMSALELKDCRYCWELHRMPYHRLAGLASRKAFNGEAIRQYMLSHAQGALLQTNFDTELRSLGERKSVQINDTRQYDVLERWGWIEATRLAECGVKVPSERLHESFFANIWLLPNGTVIRASLQPINGVTWPYHLYYMDKDDVSIFADGIPAVMRDDQDMINASTRMLLDNAARCAGPQYEINTRLLATNERITETFPFKVWARSGDDPTAQAVRIIDVPSHINELSAIKQLFEESADEVLALPRFMNGENATTGAAGTASGMSMLMGAANLSVKDLVTNYDDGVTSSFITAIYRWNMQFSRDESIKGDYNIVATGASSLVAKEVRNNQLVQFTTTLQPEERARVKWNETLKAKAESLDMGHIVMTDDEAKQAMNDPANQQAAQMQQMQTQLLLAKLGADVAKAEAETARSQADALLKRLTATERALAAAGVTLANPAAAAAGDSLLRGAGWVDADAPPAASNAGMAAPEAQANAQLDEALL